MTVPSATDSLLHSILATQEQLRREGDAASATYRARVRLAEGFRAESTIRQFTLAFDEPAAIGGSDTAPAPSEYVLAALGACQALVYATFARLLAVPIDDVSLRVTGESDPRGVFGVADVPAGFRSVRFDVRIESPADHEAVAALIASVNAHCPVLDILRRPIPTTGRYTHNGEVLQIAE